MKAQEVQQPENNTINELCCRLFLGTKFGTGLEASGISLTMLDIDFVCREHIDPEAPPTPLLGNRPVLNYQLSFLIVLFSPHHNLWEVRALMKFSMICQGIWISLEWYSK